MFDRVLGECLNGKTRAKELLLHVWLQHKELCERVIDLIPDPNKQSDLKIQLNKFQLPEDQKQYDEFISFKNQLAILIGQNSPNLKANKDLEEQRILEIMDKNFNSRYSDISIIENSTVMEKALKKELEQLKEQKQPDDQKQCDINSKLKQIEAYKKAYEAHSSIARYTSQLKDNARLETLFKNYQNVLQNYLSPESLKQKGELDLINKIKLAPDIEDYFSKISNEIIKIENDLEKAIERIDFAKEIKEQKRSIDVSTAKVEFKNVVIGGDIGLVKQKLRAIEGAVKKEIFIRMHKNHKQQNNEECKESKMLIENKIFEELNLCQSILNKVRDKLPEDDLSQAKKAKPLADLKPLHLKPSESTDTKRMTAMLAEKNKSVAHAPSKEVMDLASVIAKAAEDLSQATPTVIKSNLTSVHNKVEDFKNLATLAAKRLGQRT